MVRNVYQQSSQILAANSDSPRRKPSGCRVENVITAEFQLCSLSDRKLFHGTRNSHSPAGQLLPTPILIPLVVTAIYCVREARKGHLQKLTE
jgi:hypothetical protein